MATGEMTNHADTYGLGMHQLSYSQASSFLHQPQRGPNELQAIQMPQLHSFSSNVSTPHQPLFDLATPYDLSAMLSSDSLGQFQGLDIGHRVSHAPMPDGPSISVNKINNAFWCNLDRLTCHHPVYWIVHRLTWVRPKCIDFLFFYSILYLIKGVFGLAYLENKINTLFHRFLRTSEKK